MESMVKTKDAAEQLGVDPKTIRNWTKQYNIPCEKNGYGHYVFTKEGMRALKKVKAEKGGLPDHNVIPIEKHLNGNAVEQKLDALLRRIDQIEELLEKKADDVVTLQIKNHRQELDDTMTRVEEIAAKLEKLESGLGKVDENELNEPMSANKVKKKKTFSFFSAK